MLGIFTKKRIAKYTADARAFIQKTYTSPEPPPAVTPQPQKPTEADKKPTQTIRYSLSFPKENSIQYSLPDTYDDTNVDNAMRSMLKTGNYRDADSLLDKTVNATFVEQTIKLIREKGLKDNKVYKAAQIDRRLFSKIMSDLHYKPSKDTALALSYALELSVDQAKDLLSRAGYSLSHSDKRDIIMEFFFRERIYNITEINCILENLEQKIIGR